MYMCANKEEIRATDFFSFPPNGLKLLLYAWAQRTGLQLKNWKQTLNVVYTTFCFSKLDILEFSIFTSPSFCTNAWVNLWIWEASAWQPLTWRRVATWFFKQKESIGTY